MPFLVGSDSAFVLQRSRIVESWTIKRKMLRLRQGVSRPKVKTLFLPTDLISQLSVIETFVARAYLFVWTNSQMYWTNSQIYWLILKIWKKMRSRKRWILRSRSILTKWVTSEANPEASSFMRNWKKETLYNLLYVQGRRQKNLQGGQRKKDRKIAKKTENSNIKPIPEEGGRQRKKIPKNRTFKPLFTISVRTLYENPGVAIAMATLPSAADAHVYVTVSMNNEWRLMLKSIKFKSRAVYTPTSLVAKILSLSWS